MQTHSFPMVKAWLHATAKLKFQNPFVLTQDAAKQTIKWPSQYFLSLKVTSVQHIKSNCELRVQIWTLETLIEHSENDMWLVLPPYLVLFLPLFPFSVHSFTLMYKDIQNVLNCERIWSGLCDYGLLHMSFTRWALRDQVSKPLKSCRAKATKRNWCNSSLMEV